MENLPLHLSRGHLFVELSGELWLFDTGSPLSFGRSGVVTFAGIECRVGKSPAELTSETLSRSVGVECAGLLGADILGRFDFVMDVPGAKIQVSEGQLSLAGSEASLRQFMDIPIVTARIRDRDFPLFLDTGAQVSYFHGASLSSFPAAGSFTDFYPGFGPFETETHQVDLTLAGVGFSVRCGSLPGMLRSTLSLSGVDGIIGNELFKDRVIGYFPRRGLLVL